MDCFVIMPFSSDFTDVYDAIKRTVEGIPLPNGGQCFRLDEARPAGRITSRLLTELKAASMCVADLTGNTPNVMWEVGYAMALDKPTIIITQNLEELPFDLKDMQSLKYDRFNLSNKQESVNVLTGSWWYDEEGMETPAAPPKESGVEATWVRKAVATYPKWASRFIEEVRRDGLESHLPAAMKHLAPSRRSSRKR